MLHALIMAGGGGTRFWPRSRQHRPKQFLTLEGDRSLLQQVRDRMEGLIPVENTWIITGEAYRDETARQLPDLPAEHIIGEPCGRDTAPCIALGASLIAEQDPDAVMIVSPADHLVEPVQSFQRALHAAVRIAEENPTSLVTFGVPPTYPATAYGYIERGAPLGTKHGVNLYQVQAFREKPVHDLAERFVASGSHYWNSGIFVWKARAILKALGERQPKLLAGAERIAHAWNSSARKDVLSKEYATFERISIDYSVMEKAKEVLVIHVPFTWDDVGSWLALERIHAQDAQRNTILGQHVGIRTTGCVIVSDSGHLVATAGVHDLLIINDGNATLVADRHEEGTVKDLVEALKNQKLEKFL